MSFWLRAALGLFGVAALGALAATAVLQAYFPEPKVRALVVDAARRQLGRDVKLDHIGVGLRGLTLKGLTISESPNFAAGTFLSAERLRLRPSWRALLRRKFVAAAIAADGLTIRVIKRRDGSFNFSNLASSATTVAPAAATPAAESPPAQFDVRRILVTDSALRYADESDGSNWEATQFSADVDGLSASEPFGFALSARVRGRAGARPVDARVALDGTADLARGSRAGFSFEAKRVAVDAEGLRLEGRARVARLDAPQIDFDAQLSASGRRLLGASGKAKVADAVDFDAKVQTEPLDTTLIARFLPSSGLPALTLPSAELTASGTWSGTAATVRSAKLAWSGGHIEATGAVRGLNKAEPAYDGRATFAADLPKVGHGEYPFLHLPPRLSLPAMRAQGEAALGGGELTLKSLTLTSGLGTLSATGAVRRALSAKPVLDLTLRSELAFAPFHAGDLPFDASLPPTLSFPALKLDGGLVLRGDDVLLQKLSIVSSAGTIAFDGTLARALAGDWNPDLDAALDLSLPALTDADLPFAGVPAGLNLPASRWNGGISYTSRALRLRGLRWRVGRNDVEADGAMSLDGRGAFDALFKCRAFDLHELTGMTPDTRELQLTGTGYFALSVTGTKEKPIFAGKVRFAGLGATAAGLPLTGFSGILSADPTRLDIPNLSGKIAAGTLHADVTVKGYDSRSPELQVEASLDQFDLGRYLDAKNRLLAEHPPAAAAPSSGAAGAAKEAAVKISTRGKLDIGKLAHPNAAVEQIHAAWDVSGLPSDFADFKDFDGTARVGIGAGKLKDLGAMSTQSKILKIVLFPFVIIQKTFGLIGKITGVQLLLRSVGMSVLPDFNNIDLHDMAGDYTFRRGVMTLNQSEMDTSAADVKATGTVDIPSEKQELVVAATVRGPQILGRYVPIPLTVDVGGTFAQPTTKVRLGNASQ